MTNTPQLLGRTSTGRAHAHDTSVFCLNCFEVDLEYEDFRAELAGLAVLRMKQLAEIRVAQDGISVEDAWQGILCATTIMADVASADPARREAASLLREVIGDYIQHRVIVSHPEPRPIELAHKQLEIVERTSARLDEIEATYDESDRDEAIN